MPPKRPATGAPVGQPPAKTRSGKAYLQISDSAAVFAKWCGIPHLASNKIGTFGKVYTKALSPAEKSDYSKFQLQAKKIDAWYNRHVEEKASPQALDAVCEAISTSYTANQTAIIYGSGRGTSGASRQSGSRTVGNTKTLNEIYSSRFSTIDKTRRTAFTLYRDSPWATKHKADKHVGVHKVIVLEIQKIFNVKWREDLCENGMDTTYFVSRGRLDDLTCMKNVLHADLRHHNPTAAQLAAGRYFHTTANGTVSTATPQAPGAPIVLPNATTGQPNPGMATSHIQPNMNGPAPIGQPNTTTAMPHTQPILSAPAPIGQPNTTAAMPHIQSILSAPTPSGHSNAIAAMPHIQSILSAPTPSGHSNAIAAMPQATPNATAPTLPGQPGTIPPAPHTTLNTTAPTPNVSAGASLGSPPLSKSGNAHVIVKEEPDLDDELAAQSGGEHDVQAAPTGPQSAHGNERSDNFVTPIGGGDESRATPRAKQTSSLATPNTSVGHASSAPNKVALENSGTPTDFSQHIFATPGAEQEAAFTALAALPRQPRSPALALSTSATSALDTPDGNSMVVSVAPRDASNSENTTDAQDEDEGVFA